MDDKADDADTADDDNDNNADTADGDDADTDDILASDADANAVSADKLTPIPIAETNTVDNNTVAKAESIIFSDEAEERKQTVKAVVADRRIGLVETS